MNRALGGRGPGRLAAGACLTMWWMGWSSLRVRVLGGLIKPIRRKGRQPLSMHRRSLLGTAARARVSREELELGFDATRACPAHTRSCASQSRHTWRSSWALASRRATWRRSSAPPAPSGSRGGRQGGGDGRGSEATLDSLETAKLIITVTRARLSMGGSTSGTNVIVHLRTTHVL